MPLKTFFWVAGWLVDAVVVVGGNVVERSEGICLYVCLSRCASVHVSVWPCVMCIVTCVSVSSVMMTM